MNPKNQFNRIMMEQIGDERADDVLVQYIEKEMRIKLSQSRSKGKTGWYSRMCTNEKLWDMLCNHVRRTTSGDTEQLIDIINLAGMIMVRKELYGDEA